MRQLEEPDASQCGANAGLDVVDHERSIDPHRDALTIDDELPMIKCSHGLTEQDATEVLQIMWRRRPTMLAKQGRGANDNEAFRWRQPHRDHVDLDEVSETYPRIETFFDDVDRSILAHQFEFKVWVGVEKVGQQAIHEQGQDGSGHIDAQSASNLATQTTGGVQACREHVDCRARMGEQAFARLGQPHASCRTGEEGRANPFFQAAYRLADRGRRDSELPGRRTEASAFRHGQKYDEPIQMRSIDC